jgi:tetratricopeptide (TPR) repeat protein
MRSCLLSRPFLRNLALPFLAFFALGFLLNSRPAVAQTPAPWDAPGLAGDPDAIRTAAAAIIPDKNAAITILLEDTRISFDAEKRATIVAHLVYRVENQQGAGGWDAISAEWQPWYEDVPQIHARVIAADGHVSPLDAKTLTEGPAREQEQDTYVDDRVLKGPLPGVAAGAIVEQEIVQTNRQPFFAPGIDYSIRFGRGVPVLHTRLTLVAPESTPLHYKTRLLPDVMADKSTKDGIVTVVFDQGKLAALPPEQEMLPGDEPRQPEVDFSTGESWKSIADGYAKMADPQIRPQDVASLLPAAPAKDRTALITQLVMALHQNVRYTGIEFGVNALAPVPPSEVLRRHYGDCKDKASLLVSMLRAEKIPAYVALLSTSDLPDAQESLPGISHFNHAIVFVPGTPDLWIDATAEYAQVGDLPDPDRGREALIIRDGTTGLTMTPQAQSKDNLLIETRAFTLADQGPAKIVETSESHGEVDEQYRGWFGNVDSDAERKSLTDYARGAYLAEKLDNVDHSDGHNLAVPFHLSIEMDKAKRGYSDLDEAVVAIRVENIYSRLPRWFNIAPPDAHKPAAAADADAEPEKPRTSDVVFDPFVTEWHYRITLPQGFQVRSLPPDQTLTYGPATLTEHFESASPTLVSAVLRFDTVKGRYTPDEAMALRKAIDSHRNDDALMLRFQQTGAAQMAAGDIRGAFATYESLIALHPKEALHHVQMAYALLNAGIGEKAWAEARSATQLEPDSAIAWRALGWTLEHDSIGVRFGHGFDWQGSAAAYGKAIDLDKTTIDSQIDLGVLHEFAPTGERYADPAQLEQAVALYRAARDRDKDAFDSAGYIDNLLFDLLYSHHYDDLRQEMAKLPANAARAKFLIAAAVATDGVQAGLREADRANGDSNARNQALGAAGQLLIHMRLYPQAADILSASVQGNEDAAQAARQVEIFRTLQPYEKILFPASDPRSAVQQFFMLTFGSDVTEGQLASFLSKNSFGSPKVRKHVIDSLRGGQSGARLSADNESLPLRVIEDIVIGANQYSVQGSDATGYNVTVQPLGREPHHFFVVKEGGALKFLTDDSADRDIGTEVLELLAQNRNDDARQWLDWARDTVNRSGGDDPLAGPLLPRFWTIGDKPDPIRMKLAAASMMPGTPDPAGDIRPLLPFLRDCRSHATTPDDQTSCDLLLATSLASVTAGDAYSKPDDLHELHDVAQRLLTAQPDSIEALSVVSFADLGLKQWSDWDKSAQARLTRRPNDPAALRSLAEAATEQGNFTLARQYMAQLQSAGKAQAEDLNSLAWDSLFIPNVDQAALDAAQQGNMMTQNNNFSILHTLACVYAENGRTKEAREVILSALKAGEMEEPNAAAWYVFGRIDEQLGQLDAAAQAYRKVDKPDGYVSAGDTWVLAQKRLHAMQSAPNTKVASMEPVH